MQVKSQNRLVFLFIIIFILQLNLFSYPFLGGFYSTYNYFENDKFNTINLVSFYLNQNIREKVNFYFRLTGGFKFYTDILKIESINASKINITNFAFIPSIDLLYFEFRSKKIDHIQLLDGSERERIEKIINYDLFLFRIGRIPITHSSSILLSQRLDGLDSLFTIKNFRFKIFAATNSLDYLSFFNFQEPASSVVFTQWDLKRIPPFSNRLLKNNIDGFIGDITTSDYNFFFSNNLYDDYSVEEKERLNKLRYISVLAGRVFTGFVFELLELYYQNFTLGFLANIDLIPEPFVITFPSEISWSNNTFGGRYHSFYVNLKINGKIISGLYYNLEGIYETGSNAALMIGSRKAYYAYKTIHSFALDTKISYFFSSLLTPVITMNFIYAHGDKNATFVNEAILIKNTKYEFDHSFRSPSNPFLGYVLEPRFTNLTVVIITGSIKPFAFVNNELFSRILIETALLIFTRPVIEGATFISEKSEYLKGDAKYKAVEKAYLGFEIDLFLKWAIFSDLKVEWKTGLFIPNGIIATNGYIPYWKTGIVCNLSF